MSPYLRQGRVNTHGLGLSLGVTRQAPREMYWKRMYSTNVPHPPTSAQSNADGSPMTPKQQRKQIKDKYLAESTGPIDKLARRVKWVLLRQNRPLNADDYSAFISWAFIGNILWIFIGTTTFVGLLIYLGNLFMGSGSNMNRAILRQLLSIDNKLDIDTSDPNFKASYKDGMIELHNVKVLSRMKNPVKFALDVDKVKFSLSLNKWTDGKGLIKDISISGMAGSVEFPAGGAILDETFSSTYEIGSVRLRDSHIKMAGPSFNTPLDVDIFTCELERLRKAWLVYDFLEADALSGSFNGSLFNVHKRQNRYAHFSDMDDDRSESPWKKISRVRVDQMDLSKIFTDQSKLNWVSSSKAELIVDVMLPNEDKPALIELEPKTIWEKTKEEVGQLWHSEEERQRVKTAVEDKFMEWQDQLKNTMKTLGNDNENQPTKTNSLPVTPAKENKYVVMDFKLNLHDIKATYPQNLPCSALTHTPYVSSDDMKSLVTYVNDKKFGLTTASRTLYLEDTGEAEDATTEVDDSIPLKFRIVQSLNNYQFIDFPSLLTMTSTPEINKDTATPEQRKAFRDTNLLIDSTVSEALSMLMLYREETHAQMMHRYSERSGMDILFNNVLFGNLLLVGLGSLAI